MDFLMSRFTERPLLHLSVLHESMCISKYGLSHSRHVWVQHKEKVADISESNQNIKTSYNSKLR